MTIRTEGTADKPGTTPAGASGPVTTGDQGVVDAAHAPGPIARARKIVEDHTATFGAIPRDHWLISAIADDLAFVELASKPHRDERAELITALRDALWALDNMTAIMNGAGLKSTLTDPRPDIRAVLTKAEDR